VRKIRRQNLDKNDKIRNVFFFILLVISLIDTIVRLAIFNQDIITGLLRPVIVCLSFKNLRSTFAMILLNLKDSAVTLLMIFIFLGYFAFFAVFIFYSTF
jgi:hypothetical protein